jgi:transcriptional regulator with XRE-family HTH domain
MQDKNHTFVEIGNRLEIERDRLRMKHADFAKAGGVATSTYSNYSSGEREPKISFLSSINEVGADIVFIVTGKRVARQTEAVYQTDEFYTIVEAFNSTDEKGRQALMSLAEFINSRK